MTNSKVATIKHFSLETTEDNEDFTKVRVAAEIILGYPDIHHIDTSEVKARLQQAVKDAVWIDAPPSNPKEGDNEK